MVSSCARFLALFAIFGLMLAAPATAQEGLKKQDIERIIKEYILENPELIEEALEKLEQKRKDQEADARSLTLATMKDTLYSSKRQVVLGNPKAPITVVEFFDYNCSYCKKAFEDTLALLKEQDVRLVLKEFPILGPGSVEAARVAIAVNLVAPDRYFDFHKELLLGRGQADEKRAFKVVKSLGLDERRIRAAMADPEVGNTLEEVYTLANKLGLLGTPTYVLGDEVVFGAVGFDELKGKIASIRQCGRSTC